jgi:hypothetical protein
MSKQNTNTPANSEATIRNGKPTRPLVIESKLAIVREGYSPYELDPATVRFASDRNADITNGLTNATLFETEIVEPVYLIHYTRAIDSKGERSHWSASLVIPILRAIDGVTPILGLPYTDPEDIYELLVSLGVADQ